MDAPFLVRTHSGGTGVIPCQGIAQGSRHHNVDPPPPPYQAASLSTQAPHTDVQAIHKSGGSGPGHEGLLDVWVLWHA